jgi:uncharacterized protein YkwD
MSSNRRVPEVGIVSSGIEVGLVRTGGFRARLCVAALAAAAPLAIWGQGTAAAEGCLYQDDPVTANNLGQVERSLLCLNNAVRLRSGLNPIASDARLQGAASAHSADMAARLYFDHVTPEGVTAAARALAAGYTAGVGENIGASNGLAAILVFRAWRASPGHNLNLLYPTYQATGIGVATGYPFGGRGYTATQMFGIGPAQGTDTALDLYYPNRKCKKAKLARLGRQGKRSSPNRSKELARKLRRVCSEKPAKPLL